MGHKSIHCHDRFRGTVFFNGMYSLAGCGLLHRVDPGVYRGGYPQRGGVFILGRCCLVYHGQFDVCGRVCKNRRGQASLFDDV